MSALLRSLLVASLDAAGRSSGDTIAYDGSATAWTSTWQVTTFAKLTRNAVATNRDLGVEVRNDTASTSGNPQYSPLNSQRGTGWNSVAGASQPLDFGSQVEPSTTTAGVPTGVLRWLARQNDGTWNNVLNVSQAGALAAASTITAATGSVQTLAGTVIARRATIGTTSAAGFIAYNDTAATVGTTVQYSPGVDWQAAAWNSVGAVSEIHYWRADVRPATAAGTTSSSWLLGRGIAGGALVAMLEVSSTGALTMPTSAEPSTPAAGSTRLWYDGTNLKLKNSAGTVRTITAA